MTTYFMIFLTIVTVFVVAAGLIKVGKVPKMPAFYRNMIREGVFNRLIFKNYFFRKVLEHGKQLPETEIENVCSLYRGGDCGEKESVCYVDGDTSEWTDKDMVIQYEDGSFISVKYDASDVYLYLHKKGFDLENDTLYVPVDTTPKTGSTRMENCTEFERPTDFVLILNGKDNTRLLVQDRYNPIHANYEEDITGEDSYIDPPARDSAVFENICMVLRDVIGQYQDVATPLRTFESGKLYYGNGNPSASAYDSRADFICNGDDVEIRIPWQLLNFSDPSRMQIHDDYYDGNYGIEAVGIKEMFIGLGREGNTIEMGRLKLKGWENTVSYHERLKEAYQVLKTYWTGKEHE
jgi:hypothetical protein